MEEKQTIRLISPDGTESVVEIDKELYERFSARAKELGVSENELFLVAMDAFLKSQGY